MYGVPHPDEHGVQATHTHAAVGVGDSRNPRDTVRCADSAAGGLRGNPGAGPPASSLPIRRVGTAAHSREVRGSVGGRVFSPGSGSSTGAPAPGDSPRGSASAAAPPFGASLSATLASVLSPARRPAPAMVFDVVAPAAAFLASPPAAPPAPSRAPGAGAALTLAAHLGASPAAAPVLAPVAAAGLGASAAAHPAAPPIASPAPGPVLAAGAAATPVASPGPAPAALPAPAAAATGTGAAAAAAPHSAPPASRAHTWASNPLGLQEALEDAPPLMPDGGYDRPPPPPVFAFSLFPCKAELPGSLGEDSREAFLRDVPGLLAAQLSLHPAFGVYGRGLNLRYDVRLRPTAPDFAAKVRWLEGGGHAPLRWQGTIVLVPVQPQYRAHPPGSIQLIFQRVPVEASVQGLVQGVLSCAGYRPLRPLPGIVPDRPGVHSRCVLVLGVRLGLMRGSQVSDAATVVATVLPPVGDPALSRMPSRMPWNDGHFLTLVHDDPLPAVLVPTPPPAAPPPSPPPAAAAALPPVLAALPPVLPAHPPVPPAHPPVPPAVPPFVPLAAPPAAAASEEICPVCWEAFTPREAWRLTTPCGHSFHMYCLTRACHTNSAAGCPMCRAHLPAAGASGPLPGQEGPSFQFPSLIAEPAAVLPPPAPPPPPLLSSLPHELPLPVLLPVGPMFGPEPRPPSALPASPPAQPPPPPPLAGQPQPQLLPLPPNGAGLTTPPLLPAMLTSPALPLGGQLAPPPRFTALNPAPSDPPPPHLRQQLSSGGPGPVAPAGGLGPAGPPPQELLPSPPAPLSAPGAPRAPVQVGPVALPSRRVLDSGEGGGSRLGGAPLLASLPALPALGASDQGGPPVGSGWLLPPPRQDTMVPGEVEGSMHGDSTGGPAGPPTSLNQLPPPPWRRDLVFGQGVGTVRGGAHAPLSTALVSRTPWSSLPASGASAMGRPSDVSGRFPPPPQQYSVVSGGAVGSLLGHSTGGPAGPPNGPNQLPPPPLRRDIVFGQGVGTVRGGAHAPPSSALASRTPWSSLPAAGASAMGRPSEVFGWFPPPPPQYSVVSGGTASSLHGHSTGGPAGPPNGPNQLPPPPRRRVIVFGEALDSAHGGATGGPTGHHSGYDRFPPPPPRGSLVSGEGTEAARMGGFPPAYSPPLGTVRAGPSRADAAASWRRDQPPTFPGRWSAGGSRPLPSRRRPRSPAGTESDSVSSSSSYGSPELAPAPSTRPPPRKHARYDRAAASRPGERPGEAQ
jgi:hypothetical protein